MTLSSPKRLYGLIEKVEDQPDGTIRVFGVASSETVDDQGEIVRGSAMRDALPDYMKFPALREMHQLSAAGTTLEAEVGDDNITRITARVVDPVAVSKVKNQVYRGFSIGGRVTQREAGNPKTITGLQLSEISLVDRPANPSAILDVWKAAAAEGLATIGEQLAAKTGPTQIWACGTPGHTHLHKPEAIRCMADFDANVGKRAAEGAGRQQSVIDEALAAIEAGTAALAVLEKADKPSGEYGDVKYADPGYQDDKKPRYPIDNERHIRAAWSYINMPKNHKQYSSDQIARIKAKIVAAWKDKIDSDGPPAAADKSSLASITKSLWDIGEVASMVGQLMSLQDRLELEAAMEGDDSSAPAAAGRLCAQLCQFLRDLVAEETAEVLDGTEIAGPVPMASVALSAIAECLDKSPIADEKKARLMMTLYKIGKRHNAEDQKLLDASGYAINCAVGLPADRAKIGHLADAHKAVLDAGATNIGADGREMLTNSNPEQGAGAATQHSTVDTGRNASNAAPNPTGPSPAMPMPGQAELGNQKALSVDDLRKATGADLVAMVNGIVKAGGGQRALCQAAHDMICAAADGGTCKDGVPKPARHSNADWGNMHKAHEHLMAAHDLQCAANTVPGGQATAQGESETQGTSTTAGGAGTDLGSPGTHKIAGDPAQTDLLTKAVSDIAGLLPRLVSHQQATEDRLTKTEEVLESIAATVQKIHNAPMPANLHVRAENATVKSSLSSDGQLDDVALVAAVQGMDPVRKHLAEITLAKNDPKNRLVVHGFTDGPVPGSARRPA